MSNICWSYCKLESNKIYKMIKSIHFKAQCINALHTASCRIWSDVFTEYCFRISACPERPMTDLNSFLSILASSPNVVFTLILGDTNLLLNINHLRENLILLSGLVERSSGSSHLAGYGQSPLDLSPLKLIRSIWIWFFLF